MSDIVTDQSALRQVSTACDTELTLVNKEIVEKLLFSFPKEALGLAAPQIGVFKRMFVARLTSGVYIFVNPEFTRKSPDMIPSEEGCLSLPDTARCVERHQSVTVGNLDSGVLLRIEADDVTQVNGVLQLRGLDACIVQHECNHLDGVLLIDLPETKTTTERISERKNQRQNRIKAHRSTEVKLQSRKKPTKPRKLSKTAQQKIQNKSRKDRQRLQKRVEIQERIRAEQEGLFDSADDKS